MSRMLKALQQIEGRTSTPASAPSPPARSPASQPPAQRASKPVPPKEQEPLPVVDEEEQQPPALSAAPEPVPTAASKAPPESPRDHVPRPVAPSPEKPLPTAEVPTKEQQPVPAPIPPIASEPAPSLRGNRPPTPMPSSVPKSPAVVVEKECLLPAPVPAPSQASQPSTGLSLGATAAPAEESIGVLPEPAAPEPALRGEKDMTATLAEAEAATARAADAVLDELVQQENREPAQRSTPPGPAAPAQLSETRSTTPVRILAANILAQIPAREPVALMFTSPSDGEGKTELLTRLASAVAEQTSHAVLLVDGNLPQPDLTRRMAPRATGGLADALARRMIWSEAVQPTSTPGLSILPAGCLALAGQPLPPPERMGRLLDEMKRTYRIVLIDTASLEHDAVARLAGACDGTYLVVRLGQTRRRALREAEQIVDGCGGQVLGCVVIEPNACCVSGK